MWKNGDIMTLSLLLLLLVAVFITAYDDRGSRSSGVAAAAFQNNCAQYSNASRMTPSTTITSVHKSVPSTPCSIPSATVTRPTGRNSVSSTTTRIWSRTSDDGDREKPSSTAKTILDTTTESMFVDDSASGDSNNMSGTGGDDDGFGASVSINRKIKSNSNDDYGFGASVPSKSANDSVAELRTMVADVRTRNIRTAIASVLLAFGTYAWQFTHPVSGIEILVDLQQHATPIELALGDRNEKPTVIDFWAPWCTNCQVMAPMVKSIEQQYGDRINFVMINADEMNVKHDGDTRILTNGDIIERFRVDAIPHLALVSSSGDVITALIGPVPRSVLEADMDALLQIQQPSADSSSVVDVQAKLPYAMLDVFSNEANPNIARNVNSLFSK